MISLLSTFLSSRDTVAYGKEGQGKARQGKVVHGKEEEQPSGAVELDTSPWW